MNTIPTQQKNENKMENSEQEKSIQRAIGEGLKQAKDNFQEVQKSVTKEAKQTYDQTQQAFSEKAKQVYEKTSDALQKTSEYVSANPWTAVGFGAAVGVIFGMLISSSRRTDE